MQHLDEGTIHAWLDGELSPDEAARAEAHVASCTVCADAVAEARGLIAASSRILTALDNVPSIRGAGGAKGAGRAGRRSLSTWLVRERIAAVMTLVVAGGALALVLARDTPEATQADLEAVPVAMELAVTDSAALPPPAPGAPEEPLAEARTSSTRAAVRVPSPPPPTVASNRAGESSAAAVLQQSPTVVAEAGRAPAARTDDSVRSTVGAAQRAEARESSAQATDAMAEKAVSELARRRATDAPARYARPAAPRSAVAGAVGAAAFADGPRLVQDEKVTEEGREVRRRIYRVDGVLVTLDERAPTGRDLAAGAPIANAPPADSAATTRTIRWTDPTGTEFTLTGPAPQERLEQIRKLLGY